MPDDLDPTTARLVAELASSILPALTKSLSTSIPTGEFMSAIERTSRAGNDMRTQIERSIRSSIDDSRAGRSVMMQSIGTLSDEISSLRKAITKLPDSIERIELKLQSVNKNENVNVNTYDEMFAKNQQEQKEKLGEIKELLNELIRGLQQFSETYANANRKYDSVNVNVTPNTDAPDMIHNNGMLDKLLNETLPALEGLIKAQAKTQSKELHELSREINAMNEQNNAALIHEVREAIDEEMKNNGAGDVNDGKNLNIKKLLMINLCVSGACVLMSILMFLMLMFR